MRYVLTASAVELTFTEGNIDMFLKSKREVATTRFGNSAASGVALDKASTPPRLYGMTELPLDQPSDLLEVFAAIAVRNTSGTGLNDSSSRSHCFVWLTLYAYQTASDTMRISRFQFVDLAGSERLREAHGGKTNWRLGNPGTLEGTITNYSLLMLSKCVRDLIECRAKKQRFSFRTYLFDLVQLLS